MENNLQDIEEYLVDIAAEAETINSQTSEINDFTYGSFQHLKNIDDASTTFYVDFFDMFEGKMGELIQTNEEDDVKDKINPDKQEATNALLATIKSLGKQLKDNYGPGALKDAMMKKAGETKDSVIKAAKPGSLVKTGGLYMNSPMLMMMGDGINTMTDKITETYKLQKAKNKEAGDFNKEQTDSEEAGREEKQTIFLENIVEYTKNMAASLSELVKNSVGTGLGLIAALIAAPILLLIGFFSGLSAEMKWLAGLNDGWLAKKFEPMLNWFRRIKLFFTESAVFKAVGKWIDDIKHGFTLIADNFNELGTKSKSLGKIGDWIKSLFNVFVEKFKVFGKVFLKIGKLFGKLFIPLGIIMTAWDVISGAIDGFKSTEGSLLDKIIGAISGGLWGLFDGLVGSIVGLLTSAASWILTKFGFEDLGKSLTESVDGMRASLKELFFSPIDWFREKIRALFSFAGIELPTLDIAGFITDAGGWMLAKAKTYLGFSDPGSLEDYQQQNLELKQKENGNMKTVADLGQTNNTTTTPPITTTNVQTNNTKQVYVSPDMDVTNPDSSFEAAAVGGP